MSTPDADRAFAEFRRSASPSAMAQVFDTTAPELALLAEHLARDAGTAEDLVNRPT